MYYVHALPNFFGYKTELFSFQNKPENLDPSYKTLRLFKKGKTCITAKFHWTELLFVLILERGNLIL